MTALPKRLFGEPVKGWSIRAGRACHVIVNPDPLDLEGGAVCGVKVGWGTTVPEVPVGYRACRTCLGWLPPGEYEA